MYLFCKMARCTIVTVAALLVLMLILAAAKSFLVHRNATRDVDMNDRDATLAACGCSLEVCLPDVKLLISLVFKGVHVGSPLPPSSLKT